jgi:hypothetical protein
LIDYLPISGLNPLQVVVNITHPMNAAKGVCLYIPGESVEPLTYSSTPNIQQ